MEVFSAEHRRKAFGKSIFHSRIGNLLNVPLLGIPLIYLSRVEQICESPLVTTTSALGRIGSLIRLDTGAARWGRDWVPERVLEGVHRGSRHGGQAFSRFPSRVLKMVLTSPFVLAG